MRLARARGEHVEYPSIPDVIDAVASGDVALGLVPLENAIDGAVTATLDGAHPGAVAVTVIVPAPDGRTTARARPS